MRTETRWGQGLDPAAFPPEDIIPFGKVRFGKIQTWTASKTLFNFNVS